MKTLTYLLSVILVLISINGSAQEIYKDSNGIYCAANMYPYNGTYIQYYENGNIKSESHIIEGVLNGISTIYFENGQKNEIRSYKNGKKEGEWYLWNAEGIKVAQASYKNDKKDGKWFIWDNKGNLQYEIVYFKGERIVPEINLGSL